MEIEKAIIRSIKQKFCTYKTYYEILGLHNSNTNDKEVKEKYEEKSKELRLLLEHCSGEEIEKIRTIIQDALDDAYNALKDENSRIHYQDILDSIEGEER